VTSWYPDPEKVARLEAVLIELAAWPGCGPDRMQSEALADTASWFARNLLVICKARLEIDRTSGHRANVSTLNKRAREMLDLLALTDLSTPMSGRDEYWKRDMLRPAVQKLVAVTDQWLEDESRNGPRRGAPQKRVAKLCAAHLAAAFHQITGRPPTVISPTASGERAHGRFMDLLADAFPILEISASRESQAREAIRVARHVDAVMASDKSREPKTD